MADATNNKLMMMTIKMMAMMVMMMMMTLEHPGAPTRHSPYIEFHQDVGGSASHDLEGSSEHDHEELRISRKNY